MQKFMLTQGKAHLEIKEDLQKKIISNKKLTMDKINSKILKTDFESLIETLEKMRN